MDAKQCWQIIKQAARLRALPGGRRAASEAQMRAVNATMFDVLMDKGLRLPVLALLLQYGDGLASSTELLAADAHALLSAAYPGDRRPGADAPDDGFVELVWRAERAALKAAGQLELPLGRAPRPSPAQALYGFEPREW